MTSHQYFANISIHIPPNNKQIDIFKIYTKWPFEKCPRWRSQTPKKPRSSKSKHVCQQQQQQKYLNKSNIDLILTKLLRLGVARYFSNGQRKGLSLTLKTKFCKVRFLRPTNIAAATTRTTRSTRTTKRTTPTITTTTTTTARIFLGCDSIEINLV